MPTKYLTKDEIVETTGVDRLEELIELEILFLSFEELGSLQYCSNLFRLTCIDNGMNRISNLTPVSLSLQILCLCDQNITKMENLDLPHLRELYLHRNQIQTIASLSGCPSLVKLWLFQNQITDMSDIKNCPQLQECWLQSNQITKLQGLDHLSHSLRILYLSGNPIHQIEELQKLQVCKYLSDIALQDIHFGKCPVMEIDGIREFVLLTCPSLKILDGVKVTTRQQQQGEDMYYSQLQGFNGMLRQIEEEYQHQLRAIDLQHQSRESYSMVLEKEMSTALKELHSLVEEGRRIVHRELQSAENLIGNNVRKFSSNVQSISQQAMHSLQSYQQYVQEDYETASNMLALMECIEYQHQQVMTLFTALLQQSTGFSKTSKVSKSFAFQVIGSNAADFFMMMSNLDCLGTGDGDGTTDHASSALDSEQQQVQQEMTLKKKKANVPPTTHNTNKTNNTTNMNGESNKISFRNLELARLYKVLSSTRGLAIANEGGHANHRVYAMVSLDDLTAILSQGWNQLAHINTNTRSAQICSTNPNLLAYLMEECHFVYELNQPPIANSNGGNQNMQCGKLIFMISGQLCTSAANSSTAASTANLPVTSAQKTTLIDSLQSSTQLREVLLRDVASSTSQTYTLHTIPVTSMDQCFNIDFACLALMHPSVEMIQKLMSSPANAVNQGKTISLLRNIESRLELLLFPTHDLHQTTSIVSQYEQSVNEELKQYMDQLLEEVDESQANLLRQAEKEVMMRESSLKNIREEVERERRGQEIQLRDLRALADNAPLPTPSNPPIHNSGSLTKLHTYQNQSRTNSKR